MNVCRSVEMNKLFLVIKIENSSIYDFQHFNSFVSDKIKKNMMNSNKRKDDL